MSALRGAKRVLLELKRHGYEAYIVGGAVRDHLLKLPLTDVDITTNAKPYQVAKLFKTKPTGVKYGTVTVMMSDDTYEVTTYRIDGTYVDTRHPESVTYSDLVEEDVKRRDFRINGLLMDEREEIIDLVEGRQDIRDKIIRTIGDPLDRFNEDALRIMRAFYFQAKLGFDIDQDTLSAIEAQRHLLENIAMERIMTEIIKLLKSTYAKRAIHSMVTTKVHTVLPGLEKGMIYIDGMQEVPFVDPFFTICFTLHGSIPDAWPFSNKHRHRYQMASQLANQYESFDAEALYTYGVDLCLLANKVNVMLKRARNQRTQIESDFQNLPIQSELDLKLRAHDLMRLTGKKAGAWLKEIQKEMVLAILNGRLENKKEALEQFVLERIKT